MPRTEFASRNFYDVWLPNLAPSDALLKVGMAATTDAQWLRFTRAYVREMKRPENARVLDTLAALSHRSAFAVGCYCPDEARCHRSVLRALLVARGAVIAP